MGKVCPKCSMGSSIASELQEEETGEFVCKRNQAHRFKLDKDGWLVSV